MSKNEVDVKAVGQKIQEIRFSRGETMEEFGRVVGGVGKSNVNRWEKGNNLPNKRRLKRISQIAGITVDELLGQNSLAKYSTEELLEEIRRRLSEGE